MNQNAFGQAPQQFGQAPQQFGQAPAQANDGDEEIDMNAILGPDDEGAKIHVLAPGIYNYVITNYKQEEYTNSHQQVRKRMCIDVEVTDNDGTKVTIVEKITLIKKMGWKFCQFFLSIGARSQGDSVAMDWNNVIGRGGTLKIKAHSYQSNKTGNMVNTHRVDEFLPANTGQAQQPVAPVQQQQPVQNSQNLPPANQSINQAWGSFQQ